MNNKGFTLIELLTVISIIAILAAITLVTFPAATQRAKDARIINAMQQLRTAAEAVKGVYGDYEEVKTGGISADATINSLVAEIVAQGGTLTVHYENAAADDFSSYCAETTLNSGTRLWCVDSDMYSDYIDSTQCSADGEKCE